MLFFYQFLGFILIPIIKINLYIRLLKKKEDKARYLERYGIPTINRPQGKIIWIHAASIGEFKSSSILINKLHSNFNILVTTTTLSAANYAIENYGKKIIHQYAPFDIEKWVNRFLENWKPELSIWIESDLWPITLNLLKKKSIRSIYVNSRISPQSYKKWKFIKYFYKNIVSSFDEIFAQSPLDKKRIEFLSNRKVNYIGNLKLSLIEKNNIKTNFSNLQKNLSDFKVLMFASTHHDEEKIFLELIKRILSKINNLKIIIVPRHPERLDEIITILKKKNINCINLKDSKNFKEDIFIVGSFGKMPLYFSLSDIVILGGSFVKMGGHNPLEPAKNNCVIITGPYVYNWENIFVDMIDSGACYMFNNIIETEDFLLDLFNNSTKLNMIKNKAKKFSEKKFFQAEKLFSAIDNILGAK